MYRHPPYSLASSTHYDSMYLMASPFQWTIYPYYWGFYIEAYKLALDAWEKAYAKFLEQTTRKQ